MFKAVTLIFPHQLFEDNPAIKKDISVLIVEEELFFKQYLFHKQKLILHRASMKFYEDYLLKKGYKVTYINSTDEKSNIKNLINYLHQKGCNSLHFCEPSDNWLSKHIQDTCKKLNINIIEYTSPNFFNSIAELNEYKKQTKKYFQTAFYIHERKKRQILTENDAPVGGKWSFDAENREKLPKYLPVSPLKFPAKNNYVIEAEKYVSQHFHKNYGWLQLTIKEKDNACFYPTTFTEAKKWLADFLEERMVLFGKYEDAIDAKEHFLFHSVLTPMLNIGLLSPAYIIKETLQYAGKHNIPLNSLEGFIRQIMGWREFIKMVYLQIGSKQRTTNFWQFKRKIPVSFWQGNTGIDPVDITIKKTLATAYNHHIERLMVLGNFFLLCEFNPNHVYKWFMEMYIDAYDWVMVPNVYGMTQFADGGCITTKPYISSSNYLIKMGNYPKGKWQIIWDALFWRFLAVHQNYFKKNIRMAMLLNTWHKMPAPKKESHLSIAENYLKQLDNS